ncbi:MAG: HEAT repeat domain-containing protein [Candidatus Eutrophobiaceae bacterium]
MSIAIHAASRPDYAQLQLKIINEAATFADVRQALTDRDAKRLSETMHSLHGLIGIQRPLRKLLNALWENEGQEQYPEVAWELFAQPPVRLALASALLNSISPREKEQYLHYLLEFKYDTDEFNRGQVSKSLGAYGRPEDIPYLEEMANSESAYVVDAAATALGLMQHQAALAALQRVLEKKHGTPFGDIMEKVLRRAYRVILKTPPQSPPVEPQP